MIPDIDDDAFEALEAIIARHAPELHGCARAELLGRILDDWLPTVIDAPPDVALDDLGAPADWAIDETAERPVLTFRRCSVIQGAPALALMRLLEVMMVRPSG